MIFHIFNPTNLEMSSKTRISKVFYSPLIQYLNSQGGGEKDSAYKENLTCVE